jgi:hypothetical protein
MGTDSEVTLEHLEDDALMEEQFNIIREDCNWIVKELKFLRSK